MVSKSNSIVIEEVKDPKELAAARAQRERFDRNAAWLQTHLADIYSMHRGKVICVAGEEIFVADTAEEAIALARAAQPADDGSSPNFPVKSPYGSPGSVKLLVPPTCFWGGTRFEVPRFS